MNPVYERHFDVGTNVVLSVYLDKRAISRFSLSVTRVPAGVFGFVDFLFRRVTVAVWRI